MALQVEIWFEPFLQRAVVPLVPIVDTCVKLLRIFSQDPCGAIVRSSFVPVVISVETTLHVRVPVVVIAPYETVPIFVKLPDESILVVPFVWTFVPALRAPVTERVPVVPLSTRVSRVFGDPSASFIVSVPLFPKVERVMVGVVFESVRGEVPDNVTVPDASRVVTPLTAPAFVIPPLLLLNPPVIDAPPAVTVITPVDTVKSPPIV